MGDIETILLAFVYTSVVTLSYKKVGFVNAIVWPITIIIAGCMAYFSVVFMREEDLDE